MLSEQCAIWSHSACWGTIAFGMPIECTCRCHIDKAYRQEVLIREERLNNYLREMWRRTRKCSHILEFSPGTGEVKVIKVEDIVKGVPPNEGTPYQPT